MSLPIREIELYRINLFGKWVDVFAKCVCFEDAKETIKCEMCNEVYEGTKDNRVCPNCSNLNEKYE